MRARSRRHHLRDSLVCVAVGGIVSILVAWGCAAFSPTTERRLQEFWGGERGKPQWAGTTPEAWKERPSSEYWCDGLGVCERWQTGQIPCECDAPSFAVQVSLTAGWPLKCLIASRNETSTEYVAAPEAWANVDRPLYGPGLSVPAGWGTAETEFGRVLPLHPLWVGLAINSVLWGGALLLLCRRARVFYNNPYRGREARGRRQLPRLPTLSRVGTTGPEPASDVGANKLAPRRRLLMPVVASILGGGLVSILVAWTCAAFSPTTAREHQECWDRDRGKRLWVGTTPDEWKEPPSSEYWRDGLGVSEWWQTGHIVREGDAPAFAVQASLTAGWPLKCLIASRNETSTEYVAAPEAWVNVDRPPYGPGLAVPAGWGPEETEFGRVLPLRPLWVGFAIDSVVWGGALLLLRRLVRVLCDDSQWRREARGRRQPPGMSASLGPGTAGPEPASHLGTHETSLGRRSLMPGVVSILGGGLVSIVVAWACAAFSPSDQGELTPLAPERVAWTVAPPEGWPRRPTEAFQSEGWGVSELWQQYVVRAERDRLLMQVSLTAGWPVRCLIASVGTDRALPDFIHVQLFDPDVPNYDQGFPLPFEWRTRATRVGRGLPFQPLWAGLAADALVWGAVILTLWHTTGAIVRVRRRRSGCCASCGHWLHEPRSPCPECGAAV